MKINEYYDLDLKSDEVKAGEHRALVGGMWDEIGALQFKFMIEQGLNPKMLFLDVGCGSLRGGVHFINYLGPGNYYGIDANQSLLDAGYDIELRNSNLQSKMPRQNLLVNRKFEFSLFGKQFDYALAQSVFTHLPLNHIRHCLINLSGSLKPGGQFFATFFECPESSSIEADMIHEPGGIKTFIDQDPYHYKVSDLEWCVRSLPLQVVYIGEWGHPRAQKMVCFNKQ